MFSGHDPLRMEAVAWHMSAYAEECHPTFLFGLQGGAAAASSGSKSSTAGARTKTLASARQRPPQFPLRPYNTRQRNDDQLTRHERIARKHDCRTTGPRDHAHPAPPKRSKSMTRWVVPGTRPTRSDSSSRPSCSRRSPAATDENAKGQEATVDAVMRGEKPAPSA
jgi:hypothetical protein